MVLTVVMIAYAALGAVALAIAAAGIFAADPEPLAAVYAIVLAAPWFMLGADFWPQGAGLNFLILVLCILANLGLLALARRLLTR